MPMRDAVDAAEIEIRVGENIRIIHYDDKVNIWNWGNRILYKMCEDNPNHEDPNKVIGKVLLIGRAYAAAVERRTVNLININNDSFYRQFVFQAFDQIQIDNLLGGLPNDPGAPEALELHSTLMAAINEITGNDKRSFVSKYLHFHKPDCFYIYDARVVKAIKRIEMPYWHNVHDGNGYDTYYFRFVSRCNALREHIRGMTEYNPSPREIDNLLLCAEQLLNQQ